MPRTKRVPKPNKKYVEGKNEDVTVTTFAVKSPPEVEDEKIDEEEKEYDSASDLEEDDAIKPGELVPGKGYVKDTEKMSPMTKVPGVATKIDHVTPSPPVEKNTKRESSDISAPLERCGENTTTEASIYVLRVNGGEFTIRLSTTLANEYIRSMGGENKFDIIKSFQSLPEAKKFIIDCTAPGNKDSQQEQGASVTAALPANKKPRVENGGAALPFGISPFSNGGDFSAQTQKKKYGSSELDELTKYIQNNGRKPEIRVSYVDKEYCDNIILVFQYFTKNGGRDWRLKAQVLPTLLRGLVQSHKNSYVCHPAYATAECFALCDPMNSTPKVLQTFNKKSQTWWNVDAVYMLVKPTNGQTKEEAARAVGVAIKGLFSTTIFKVGYSKMLECEGMIALMEKMGGESSPLWEELRSARVVVEQVQDFGVFFMPDLVSKLESILVKSSVKQNLIDILPTELVVEISTYLFAGPTLRVDLHSHYKQNMFPLLLAYPTLWNELMVDRRFRFWYSMMKTRYYRDNQMRQSHSIGTDVVMDEHNQYSLSLTRERRERESTYRKNRRIGPVIYRIPYYRGMAYFQKFNHMARYGMSSQQSGRMFDRIVADSREGFCHDVKEHVGVYTGLAEMWPYHSREDPAMGFHLHLKQRRDIRHMSITTDEMEAEFERYLQRYPV